MALMSSSGSGIGGIGGMPGRVAAAVHDRNDQLAVLIVQHELRSQQVDAAHVAAAQVGAVAEPAVDAVERGAALDDRGIGGRALRFREPLSAAPAEHRRRGRRERGGCCAGGAWVAGA